MIWLEFRFDSSTLFLARYQTGFRIAILTLCNRREASEASLCVQSRRKQVRRKIDVKDREEVMIEWKAKIP